MSQEDTKVIRKEILGSILEELRADKLFGIRQRTLEARISAEARRLAGILRRNGWDLPEGVDRMTPNVVSVLPMPNLEANRSDCIVLENEELSASSASSITDEQMEAADISKSRGYVLTDEAWREIVFIATRTVLFKGHSAAFQISLAPMRGADPLSVHAKPHIILDVDSVARRVGINRDRLAQLHEAALACGYFDSIAHLAPVNLDENVLASIARNLRSFSGQGNWTVTDASVRAYLAQFPPKLRDPMAKLLSESLVVFDRTRLATDIGPKIRSIPLNGAKGVVVALSPDSGNTVRIQLEQELRARLVDGWEFAKSIRDALQIVNPSDHLVFCDDNVSSGSQAVCQFKSWVGAAKTAQELEERGVELTALDIRDQELLRKVVIHIVTSAGTKGGTTYLETSLKGIGLKFGGLEYEVELETPALALGRLDAFLEAVGTQVLAWSRHHKTLPDLTRGERRACRADALGYAGARALICTPMNVPVATLTALWCPGLYNGRPWMPLVIRRGYLDRLVLS
jgi:deoxynucleoside triphosphate triphosphohydrolase SAMHD1